MNESSARSHRPTGRVLLCNIGRVGDTILRNSILDSVFRTYAAVDYLCGPGNFDVVRSDPRMDRVILLRNQPGHFLSLFKQALRQRYEGYIDLKDHDSSTSLLIARLFRCGNKTGVNRPRNRPFHHDTRGVWVPGLHKVEVMKLIAGKAGLIPGEFRPALVCPPEAAAWFRAHHPQAGPFILLNISATHPNRTWQAEKWIQFLREVALPAWPIVVNAVPADRPLAQQICAQTPRTTLMHARTFLEVAAAVAAARLVLTVNTGVIHACSAFDKPVVVLANGPDEIREFRPLSAWQLIIEAMNPLRVPDITLREAVNAMNSRLPLQL